MKNDPKLIAMVAAILSGFKNDITVSINVHGKNGENATISVYEFTKDEAGRFLVDALQKNCIGKTFNFAIESTIKALADDSAEQESKQVYDLSSPFAERIPDECELAWIEFVESFQTIGQEVAKQIYNNPSYHKYGECKIDQALRSKLQSKQFIAQKTKARATFVEKGVVHLFDKAYPAFLDYIKYVSRSIKSVFNVNGFDDVNKRITLDELSKIFSSSKYQKINLRGRRPK